MKKISVFMFLIYVSNQVFGLSIYTADSIGIVSQNEKQYIIHQVEAGETLFALSRKYGIDVEAIRTKNPSTINGINIGQKLMIPYQKVMSGPDDGIHYVKSSETLFSISRLYNVRVDDLKIWNNLHENTLVIGQKLIVRDAKGNNSEIASARQMDRKNRMSHVVEQSQTLYAISRMYDVSTNQLMEWNNLQSSDLEIGQVLVVSETGAENTEEILSNSSMLPVTDKEPIKEQIADIPTNGDAMRIERNNSAKAAIINDAEEEQIEKPKEKITEKGLAEVIENTSETKKYLALHREAPAGTIMQVRNEMNSQSVFVRVVGPIPPTGDNSKVILKISKKAFDRLGAVDSRFPVEISYIP